MDQPKTSHPCLDLLSLVENQLLPGLVVQSVDHHNPVRVEKLPQPWDVIGCGNYAAVLLHPEHPDLVVKIYAPGRQGIEQEAEVYRRIGEHPAFSRCLHAGESYLVLRRLRGITLYDCLRTGMVIPPQAIEDIDAALAYATSRGLHGHDVRTRSGVGTAHHELQSC